MPENIEMPDIPKSMQKYGMTKSEMVVSKIFSGRFLIVIALTFTLCSLAWIVVNKFNDNKELVALIVGQFIFICKDIVLKYFDREDRSSEPQLGSLGEKKDV